MQALKRITLRFSRTVLPALVLLCVALPPPAAFAQDICANTPDPAMCEQLKSQAEAQGLTPPTGELSGAQGTTLSVPGAAGALGTVQTPAPTIEQTAAAPKSVAVRGHSKLEDLYSQRAGAVLSQYGYDLIGNGGTIQALQIGAIQDDYILGQGDAVVVTLRGQENATYSIFVDRDGNVILPRLRPISAGGRRFGDFRADLLAAIRQSYLQTQAFITLGQVRQISVNVTGEVTNPGVYALSGLSTVLDALNVAGGIRKSGSLRRIAVVRAGGTHTMDIYQWVSAERAPSISLRQDDKIYVPPLGATVAVSGEVRRPGIYELPPGARAISAEAALSLANGFAIRGAYRLTALRTLPDGKLEYESLTAKQGLLRDGEILFVDSAENFTQGNVTLAGNVRLPGTYALSRAKTLHALLPSSDSFLPMTYMPFGFVVRQNRSTLMRDVIPFSVQALIDGKFDLPLQSLDKVHILDFDSMQALVDLDVQSSAPKTDRLYDENGVPIAGFEGASAASGLATTKLYNENGVLVAERNGLEQPGLTAPGTAPASGSPNEATAKAILRTLTGRAGTPAVAARTTRGAAGADTGAAPDAVGASAEGSLAADTSGATIAAVGASTESGTGEAGEGEAGSAGAGAEAMGVAAGIAGLSSDEAGTLGFVVSDYRVTLEGAVRQPGDYLAAPQTTLAEVVQAANGLTPAANLAAIEITSRTFDNVGGRSVSTRKDYSLTPLTLTSVGLERLDVIRIPSVITDQEEGDVIVAGEVNFPGTYHVLKGERLSSVLARAGGLTNDAYPQGAVFQRPSVARVQQQAHQREADDLQKQLMATVARAGNLLAASASISAPGLSAESAGFVEDIITQLRNKPADGRISVIADPAALAADPAADIEIRPGDKLFVPKRPSEVDVTGEVLNPGSFRFTSKLDLTDYIQFAGGYDRYADEDHIFVVNPDGTSQRVSDELFDFTPQTIAPGSMIVVPRDLAPLDLGALTVTVSKVLSDFAISAASLAVLSKNN